MQIPFPQFIGAHIRRREDPNLVTGRGRFVADFRLKDTLHMAVARSPYGHAKILRIDKSRSEKVPGVLGVLTASEINSLVHESMPVVSGVLVGDYDNLVIPEQRPLQSDKVRYFGDPVAIVLAESPYISADALEQLYVEYEPLSVTSSSRPDSNRPVEPLHEESSDNSAFSWNVSAGDAAKNFANSDVTVELPIKIQRLIPGAMEPRAVLARYTDNQFTIWSSTQVPHGLRDSLASILKVSRKKIRVIAPEVGGGFGAKSNIYPEEVLVPLMARQFGRPVRWVASRSEDYQSTSHGRDQQSLIRLAATSEGKITAVDLEVVADCGAYHARCTPCVAPFTGMMISGVYDIPNGRAQVKGVFTNKSPMEPYRGAGRPEAAYMIERGVDVVAKKLGMDPAELRRRNFIQPDQFPFKSLFGLYYDSGDYEKALQKALQLVDYSELRRKQRLARENDSRLIGIGISTYVEICGFGPWESGAVRVMPDGKVTVLTGSSPQGQGHETTWAQICAEVLQVPMEDVDVKHGDTAIVQRGIGTFGSRSVPVGASAVHESSEIVRQGAREIAANLMEAAPADIVLEKGAFQVVGSPQSSLNWEQIVSAAYAEGADPSWRELLTADLDYKPKGETYPFGVHICIVEINSDTGQVEIVRFLTVDDCGHVINPLLAQGQVHGGLAQGIGQALYEEAVYAADGTLTTGTLLDYALPKAHQLPSYETHRTETPTPLNPLGAKGIGEAATIGSTPATVNAVVDALSHLGITHIDTPLTPEKVWRAIQATQT
jgi:carbon-monoxide dehydrogenase large subunit